MVVVASHQEELTNDVIPPSLGNLSSYVGHSKYDPIIPHGYSHCEHGLNEDSSTQDMFFDEVSKTQI